ncbi:MAG: nicotinate phosphoribosyltransferase [Actinobacteria bacterium]|nr:nicotinate phosphoribosyltransferase [Actinomycetota bacterium]
MEDRLFHIATEDEIKSGEITDVYFLRDLQVLKAKGIQKHVLGEARAATLPQSWPWGIYAGVEELAHLFSGVKVDIDTMDEGTLFRAEEVVVNVSGIYTDFAIYETSMLGLICQASGIATRAAKCKLAAGERSVISFGARRMHPAISPMIERNAFIGGCDGVAVTKSAELIGEKPVGTMPHALIIAFEDEVAAFKAFDEIIDPSVRRVALIDTFEDEKFGALKAAYALGDRLFGIRLDTPGSRRGNFLKILEEVRWELDLRGFEHVKLFLSGGLDETKIAELNKYADAYGVGTYISSAPVVDFSFDLVEVSGKPLAKRGKMSGAKQVWRCENCLETKITPKHKSPEQPCICGGEWVGLLKPLIKSGEVVRDLPSAKKIRKHVLHQLSLLDKVF